MGRRNKTYSKDLHQQAYDQLTGMLAFGESKKEAMATGTAKNKIFSHATYKNYWKHIKYFLGYIKENLEECKEVCQRVAADQSGSGPLRMDGAIGGKGPRKAVRNFSG